MCNFKVGLDLSTLLSIRDWHVHFSLAVVSFLMFILYKITLFLIPAVFFGVLLLIKFLLWICSKFKSCYYSYQWKNDQKHKRLEKELDYKNIVWRYFYIVPDNDLNEICCLLDLEKLPNNHFSHILSNNKPIPNKIYSALFLAEKHFNSSNNDLKTIDLIRKENVPAGCIINFDPYLYSILLNYKNTHRKESLF